MAVPEENISSIRFNTYLYTVATLDHECMPGDAWVVSRHLLVMSLHLGRYPSEAALELDHSGGWFVSAESTAPFYFSAHIKSRLELQPITRSRWQDAHC